MTSTPGWRPEDWLDGYGPLDPGGFIEAQRSGWEAASSIMARFAETWSAAVAGTDTGAAVPTAPTTGASDQPADGDHPSDPFHSVRVEAARSLDAVMDITRKLVESSLDLADAAMRRPAVSSRFADGDGSPSPVVLQATPGSTTVTSVWLHHQGPPTGPVTLHVLGPSAATTTGDVATVSFQPAAIDRLDPGDSVEVRIGIAVPADTAVGTYHGLVLVDGLDELALPLRLEVGVEVGVDDGGSDRARTDGTA